MMHKARLFSDFQYHPISSLVLGVQHILRSVSESVPTYSSLQIERLRTYLRWVIRKCCVEDHVSALAVLHQCIRSGNGLRETDIAGALASNDGAPDSIPIFEAMRHGATLCLRYISLQSDSFQGLVERSLRWYSPRVVHAQRAGGPFDSSLARLCQRVPNAATLMAAVRVGFYSRLRDGGRAWFAEARNLVLAARPLRCENSSYLPRRFVPLLTPREAYNVDPYVVLSARSTISKDDTVGVGSFEPAGYASQPLRPCGVPGIQLPTSAALDQAEAAKCAMILVALGCLPFPALFGSSVYRIACGGPLGLATATLASATAGLRPMCCPRGSNVYYPHADSEQDPLAAPGQMVVALQPSASSGASTPTSESSSLPDRVSAVGPPVLPSATGMHDMMVALETAIVDSSVSGSRWFFNRIGWQSSHGAGGVRMQLASAKFRRLLRWRHAVVVERYYEKDYTVQLKDAGSLGGM